MATEFKSFQMVTPIKVIMKEGNLMGMDNMLGVTAVYSKENSNQG